MSIENLKDIELTEEELDILYAYVDSIYTTLSPEEISAWEIILSTLDKNFNNNEE